MCGIAGIVDLAGTRPVPARVLRRMADALYHRGPDEDGYLERPGLGLSSRRLSIVGLADGRQPIFNENRRVAAVYNGEIFDYPEMRAQLEARGHVFRTHCDTELLPHLWEDHQEAMLDHLRGQFALAVWDEDRRRLLLARDRFGICPLFWTRQRSAEGDWLLFASEIKALLASGMVKAQSDARGIDQVFNFLAMPGPATCFQGVQLLQPGHALHVRLGGPGETANVQERTYWQIDFPDAGEEDPGLDEKKLIDGFEEVLFQAVERRLRADVPVVSYLSGGIDSSIVVAMACKARGEPIPTFTIQVPEPTLDETEPASVVSRHVGATPVIVRLGREEVTNAYPRQIWAAESPVVDTSCTGLLLLAREVHRHGYKVALTGEGSDEWLAGYFWHKLFMAMEAANRVPFLGLGNWSRRLYFKSMGMPPEQLPYLKRLEGGAGGHSGFHDLYAFMGMSRFRFYNPQTLEAVADYHPYLEMEPNPERLTRWHPLNRSLYWGGRIHLAGLLLSAKGDRVAMHSSVETRYPFLDENVFAYLARLHPRWKLRRLWDKFILRKLGERWLPKEIAWRPKGMFRAPLDSFFSQGMPPFVDQLLSEESLRKTGYFDPAAVQHWRKVFPQLKPNSNKRIGIELGLVAVTSTQLWHHTFLDPTLADLPTQWKSWELEKEPVAAAV